MDKFIFAHILPNLSTFFWNDIVPLLIAILILVLCCWNEEDDGYHGKSVGGILADYLKTLLMIPHGTLKDKK